jgi:hypothetical protein
MRIISIDPGLHGCGVAWWASGRLARASYVVGSPKHMRDALAWRNTVRYFDVLVPKPDVCVIEFQQIYDTAHSIRSANDLLQLAAVVGGIAAVMPATTKVFIYKPAQWKGSVKKSVTKNRLREYKLSEDELACVSLPDSKDDATDVWDAVGIGLKHLEKVGLRVATKPPRFDMDAPGKDPPYQY